MTPTPEPLGRCGNWKHGGGHNHDVDRPEVHPQHETCGGTWQPIPDARTGVDEWWEKRDAELAAAREVPSTPGTSEPDELTAHIRAVHGRIRLHDGDYITHLLKEVDAQSAELRPARAVVEAAREMLNDPHHWCRWGHGPAHDDDERNGDELCSCGKVQRDALFGQLIATYDAALER